MTTKKNCVLLIIITIGINLKGNSTINRQRLINAICKLESLRSQEDKQHFRKELQDQSTELLELIYRASQEEKKDLKS